MESIGDGKHASDRNLESTKQMLEIVEKPAYENDNHLVWKGKILSNHKSYPNNTC